MSWCCCCCIPAVDRTTAAAASGVPSKLECSFKIHDELADRKKKKRQKQNCNLVYIFEIQF
jgi:hypothetical protein